MENECRRVEDLIQSEDKQINDYSEAFGKYTEQKIETSRQNTLYRESLSHLQCQNSGLIGQLETFQRENEEVMYMLRRDEDYKELKVTIGSSIQTAQDIMTKKRYA